MKESFANTLRSMLHSRIDYPKDDDSKAGQASRRSDTQKMVLPPPLDRDATRGGRSLRTDAAA